MLESALLCCVGFVLLYFGAEWLVRGSASLARSLGISPIVIGLTVVAFGTSAPELFVSVVSALDNQPMIAVGNAIGSNICNIALVLGMTAVVAPVVCARVVCIRDIPLMVGLSLVVLLFSRDGHLSRPEGAILFGGLLVYIFLNYLIARRQTEAGAEVAAEVEEVGTVRSRPLQLILIVAGIAGVLGGAKLVVDSAVVIMEALGVSRKFIGLTVVAFGTSLPELATSVVAALRRQMDISIGNLVGSNVFNILGVIGAASFLSPNGIPIQEWIAGVLVQGFVETGMYIDYGVMIFTSLLPWLFLLSQRKITRRHGFLLLACYGVYLTYLILKAGA